MSTVGIDHFIAIAAIVVTSLFVLLCLTRGQSGENAADANNSHQKGRKKEFSLPVIGAHQDDETNAESLRVFDRLALTRSNGCVVTLSIPKASSKDASVWRVVTTMMKVANVFLIIKATSTAEEEAIWDQILNVNNLSLEKHRVIFHETAIGKVAIVRQLRPQLHVDFDTDCCSSVAPHISSVVEFRSVSGTSTATVGAMSTTGKTTDGKAISWRTIQCLEDVLSITLQSASNSSRPQ